MDEEDEIGPSLMTTIDTQRALVKETEAKVTKKPKKDIPKILLDEVAYDKY